MSAAHTPGPWELDDENGVCAGGVYIAAVTPVSHKILRSIDQETWNANADLIAAAPELLEVARHLDAAYSAIHGGADLLAAGHPSMALWAEARAAIARATGAAQ